MAFFLTDALPNKSQMAKYGLAYLVSLLEPSEQGTLVQFCGNWSDGDEY